MAESLHRGPLERESPPLARRAVQISQSIAANSMRRMCATDKMCCMKKKIIVTIHALALDQLSSKNEACACLVDMSQVQPTGHPYLRSNCRRAPRCVLGPVERRYNSRGMKTVAIQYGRSENQNATYLYLDWELTWELLLREK